LAERIRKIVMNERMEVMGQTDIPENLKELPAKNSSITNFMRRGQTAGH
jgi:hypothetical protein